MQREREDGPAPAFALEGARRRWLTDIDGRVAVSSRSTAQEEPLVLATTLGAPVQMAIFGETAPAGHYLG